MKRLLIILMMVAAFTFGFFGQSLLSVSAHAESEAETERNCYVTSIQIQKGESLWTIASRYAEGSGYSVQEYVEELKRMNGLRYEDIHSGEYLTVIYFAE